MKSELEAVALILVLFGVTVFMGLEFGGSGLGGSSPLAGGGPTPGKTGGIAGFPLFVFRAEGPDATDPSSLLLTSSNANGPGSALVPLKGVRVTLTNVEARGFGGFSHLPADTLVSNASGLASTYILPGNYSVLITDGGFSATTMLSTHYNETTTLDFRLQPSSQGVSSVRVASPDSIATVEPSTTFYVLLANGPFKASESVELVGFAQAPAIEGGFTYLTGGFTYLTTNSSVLYLGPIVGVNATVLGLYQGTNGVWAALSPTGSYSAFPTSDLRLFQFLPTYEVSYGAS